MAVLGISGGKGGLGKTTTAVELGRNLADRGARVLLVDCDAQKSLSLIFGLQSAALGLSDVLGTAQDGHTAAVDAVSHIGGNLSVLPAGGALALTVANLPARRASEIQLTKALAPIVSNFDYIVLDSPPTLSAMLSNILLAADHIIAMVTPDLLAIDTLGQLVEQIDAHVADFTNAGRLLGSVLARYDNRQVLSRDARDLIFDTAHYRPFQTTIRERVAVREAQALRQPIDPKSDAAADYRALTDEILQRI